MAVFQIYTLALGILFMVLEYKNNCSHFYCSLASTICCLPILAFVSAIINDNRLTAKEGNTVPMYKKSHFRDDKYDQAFYFSSFPKLAYE